MYLPQLFEEKRLDILHSFVRDHPFGALVVLSANGLEANHLPFEIDAASGPFGTLHCHVSRANPVWRNFSPDTEALAIFQGPNTYITPTWYPSKQETGKDVPTWNYIVVHARGPMRVIDDVHHVRAHLEKLVAKNEKGRPHPWQITDAPEDYVNKQLSLIVGIEIPLASLVGKWKLGQNRQMRDRHGMLQGLIEADTPETLAVAAEVRKTLEGTSD
jgi:transcriptional regulator